jgi:N-acetylglucosamine-6-phosphate deacetylase
MKTIITGGTILTPDQALPGHDLVIEGGAITAVLPADKVNIQAADRLLTATGRLVAPGMIDLHIHGSLGSDTMDASSEALDTIAHFLARRGVTSFLATTITTSRESLTAAVLNAAAYGPPADGAQCLGIHLEGPYLSPAYAGVQPAGHLRLPDTAEFTAWLDTGAVRLVTLAPELEGALGLIELARGRGCYVAVGHSQASYEQVMQAADCGLTHSTHTFNAMQGLHHRLPGTAGAVLDDSRIYAEVIADGHHVHPAVFRLLLKAKGVERTILVTDAMRAAGLGDGEYDFGGQVIRVQAGLARGDRGQLAGSTLTLDQALRNAAAFSGLALEQALPMATRLPAASIGLAGKKGVLQPGADADVILFDPAGTVQGCVVAGNPIFWN